LCRHDEDHREGHIPFAGPRQDREGVGDPGLETITILASEVPFVGGEVMNGFGCRTA
jgi:hypothetical protein